MCSQFNTEINIQTRTRFFDAVKSQDLTLAKNLLLQGADINYLSRGKSSALDFAIRNNDLAMVRLLLTHGADPNLKNVHNSTPLFTAIESDNLEITSHLLQNGANPNIKDFSNRTPMQCAFETLNLDLINLLLKNGAKIEFESELNIVDLLYKALCDDNQSFATAVIVNFAHLVPQNPDFFFIMKIAIERRNGGIIKLLLENGFDVDQKDDEGNPILYYAILNQSYSCVKMLLNVGAKVDFEDQEGKTPLHHASLQGMSRTAELLIQAENESLVERKDGSGKTALDYALQRQNLEIVEFLYDHGASLRFENVSNKMSFLSSLVISKNVKVARLFLEYCKFGSCEEVFHQNIMYAAVRSQSLEMVQLLIDHGVDVNSVCMHDKTPLQLAVKYKDVRIVELLLEQGADVTWWDAYDQTPMDYAVLYGNDEAVRLLVKYGAWNEEMENDFA